MARRALISTIALCAALVAVELLTRALSLDQKLTLPLLFFEGADVPVHRVSTDSLLHYELAPRTGYVGEAGGRHYGVKIDEHGARYPTHPATKGAGVFRIQCGGASTMYGAAVDDNQTIAAALERRLNAAALPGTRFEVWNFGTSGYTAGQAAHKARMELAAVDPDLVLIQLARTGRRGFLVPASGRLLDYEWDEILADPKFLEEHFDFDGQLPALVAPLLRRSAFARACAAGLAHFWPADCTRCAMTDQVEAEALSRAAEGQGVPVVHFAIPYFPGLHAHDVFPSLPAERFIDLNRPNRAKEFYEVHPPAATLDEFAQLLAAELQSRGLVGKAPGSDRAR